MVLTIILSSMICAGILYVCIQVWNLSMDGILGVRLGLRNKFKVIDGWHERQMSSGLELDENDLTIDSMNQLANESMQDLEYYQTVWKFHEHTVKTLQQYHQTVCNGTHSPWWRHESDAFFLLNWK